MPRTKEFGSSQSVVEKLLRKDADNSPGNTPAQNDTNNKAPQGVNTSANIPSAALSNVLDNVKSNISQKDAAGSSHTFYLSADVSEDLLKTAASMGISKSKLVDNILREVLLAKQ